MLRPLLLGSALIFASVSAASAYPMDEVEVQSKVVHFGDLDINYAPDADVLLDRIHTAARHVCTDSGSIVAPRHNRDCQADSESRAVAQVDNPMLTARFNGVTPEVVIADDSGAYVDPSYKK